MTVTLSAPRSRPRANLLSGALAAALGVAGLIHCLLMPDHFAESTILGLGFLTAAAAQIGLAALVLLRPRRWVYAAVIGASASLMGLYAVNVAVGLPFHAAHAEPVVVTVAHGPGTDADHHGATDHHGAGTDHAEGAHGTGGLAIGAGEPVDAWGATTQLAQLSSVGIALVLLRRRP